MKKILIFALVALMTLSFFCACDGQQTDGEQKYSFFVGETEILPGDEAAGILAVLGEPGAYDESPSCAFEGLDKVYTYSGFEIQTFTEGGKDYVYIISLTNDLVKTPEGISIGASKTEVVAKYGDQYTSVGENMQYEAENCTLQFIFRDGKVSSIKYTAKV
jgi:hypothetical protein